MPSAEGHCCVRSANSVCSCFSKLVKDFKLPAASRGSFLNTTTKSMPPDRGAGSIFPESLAHGRLKKKKIKIVIYYYGLNGPNSV